MAYAVLEAEIRGNIAPLRADLVKADNLMNAVAGRDRVVHFRLDPGIFAQIQNVRQMLSTIGVVDADVNLNVNGVPVAMQAMKQATATVREARAEVELLHKNLSNVGGSGSIKLGLKDLLENEADVFDQLTAKAVKFKETFGNDTGIMTIIGKMRALPEQYERKGIDASGIREALPALEAALMLEKQLKAERTVEFEVKVNDEGIAKLEKVKLLIDQTERDVTAAQKRMQELKAAGFENEDAFARFKNSVADATKFFQAQSKERIRAFEQEEKALAVTAERMRVLQAAGFSSEEEFARYKSDVGDATRYFVAQSRERQRIFAEEQQQAAKSAHDMWEFYARDAARAERQRQLHTNVLERHGMSAAGIDNEGLQQLAENWKRIEAAEKESIGLAKEYNKVMEQSQRLINGQASFIERWEGKVDRAFKRAVQGSEELRESANGLPPVMDRVSEGAKAIYNTIVRWAVGYYVVSTLINLLNGLKNSVIDFNTQLEKAQITFSTLLGSEVRAQRFLNTLREFAKITPFEFKDLLPLTQRLVALGVVAKNEVEAKALPALVAIGNASAALGSGREGIERIVTALGQMAQKGKASAEEVTQQLGEIGINGAKYIADAMGVSVSKVFDLMKKGAIDGRQAALAILQGMANDPAFGGMMQKFSQTFEGATSNIIDSMRELLAEGFKPVYDSIRDSLIQLAKIMSTDVFKSAFVGSIQNLIRAFNLLGAALRWLYDVFANLLPIIAGVMLVIYGPQVIEGIQLVILWIRLYGVASITTAARVAAAWAVANASMLATIAVVAALVLAYRKFTFIQNITEDTVLNILLLFKNLAHGFAWLEGQITNLLARLAKIVAPDWLLNRLGGLGSTIKDWRDSMINAFSMENAEVDSDKFFDELIDGWIRKGSKRFKSFMTGDLAGALGIKDFVQAALSEANKATGGIDLSKLKVIGSLLRNGADDKGKLAKDRLADEIRLYEALAKAAEESAKKQIEALKKVADAMQNIIGGMQDTLAQYGIFTSPLDEVINRMEKLLNLGPRMTQIATNATEISQAFRGKALEDRKALDKMRGGTGTDDAYAVKNNLDSPGQVSDKVGDMIAREAVRMQGVASRFAGHCDQLADTTVRTVTSAFNKIMGPRPGDTAARTMARFMAAGIGFAPNGSFQAGDIAYTGRHVGGGSGHVQIVGPDGKFYDQYGAHKRPTTRPEWVVRPGGSATGGGRGGVDVSGEGQGPNLLQILQENLRNLGLSKYSALPKEFGPALAEGEGHATRFATQMKLADTAFQNLMRERLGGQFPEWVRLLAKAADETDRLAANAQGARDVRAMQRSEALRGKENDPMAQLAAEFGPGGARNAADVSTMLGVWWQTRVKVIGDAKEAIDKLSRSEADHRRVLEAGAPFIKENSVDVYELARAQDLLAKKIEFARSAEMSRLYNTDRKKFNEELERYSKIQERTYDYGKAWERRQAIAEERQALDRRAESLRAQIPLIENTSLTEQDLSDSLARQASYYEKLQSLIDKGFTKTRADQLATELSRTESVNAALERQIALMREGLAAQLGARLANESANNLAGIYGSSPYGSEAQERMLKLEQAFAPLRERAAKGEFNGLGGTKTYVDLIEAATTQVDAAIKTEKAANAANAAYQSGVALLGRQNEIRIKALDLLNAIPDAAREELGLETEISQRRGTTNPMLEKEIENRRALIELTRISARLEFARRQQEQQDSIDALRLPDDGTGRRRATFLNERTLERMRAALDVLKQQAGVEVDPEKLAALKKAMEDIQEQIQRVQDGFKMDRAVQEAQRSADAIRQIYSQLASNVAGSLDVMVHTSGNVFERIEAGAADLVAKVADYFLKLAEQILANWVITQILGALGGASFLGTIQAAANAGPMIPGNGGGSSNNSHVVAPNTGGGHTASSQSIGAVNIVNNFPNVRDAASANGVAEKVNGQIMSTDSRRTTSQNISDVNALGQQKRS